MKAEFHQATLQVNLKMLDTFVIEVGNKWNKKTIGLYVEQKVFITV